MGYIIGILHIGCPAYFSINIIMHLTAVKEQFLCIVSW